MTQLQGKVAFITGGSKGIGFGIAKVLLQKGIHVAITSRSLESAQKAANQLSVFAADSAKVLALKADVRDYQQQQDAVKATERTLGSIDIVIANAGLGVFGSIEDITIEGWNQVIETNLTGVFYTLKSTLGSLKKQKDITLLFLVWQVQISLQEVLHTMQVNLVLLDLLRLRCLICVLMALR